MLNRRRLLIGTGALLASPWPARAACTPLLTDTTVRATPSMAKPAYLGSYLDPTFGTTIKRVSGNPGSAIPNVSGGVWGDVCRIGYSKRGPWNCDGSLFWLEVNKYAYGPGSTGTTGGIFCDGSTFTPIRDGDTKPSSSDCRWHVTDPALMYYVKSSGEFGTWNVNTGAKNVIRTFSGYLNMTFGRNEGNCDRNGDVFVFSGQKVTGGPYVCFAYKISTDNKYPEINTTATLGGDLANATVNLDGTRVIVQYEPENIAIFNLSGVLQLNFGLPSAYPSHWDIGEIGTGADVVLGVAKGTSNSGKVIRRKISDGSTTELTTGDSYASHTSCRDVTTQTWIPAFVSYEAQPSYPLYSGEIVATNADVFNTTFRLCHTHNEHQSSDYEAETRGAPDWYGARVAFSSNWHNSGSVQAYVCTVAPRCPIGII